MKVIELLQRIANGEEVPKKVKYKTYLWKYSEKDSDYIDIENDHVFSYSNYDIPEMLNNEVEVIEEDKKIKKLPTNDGIVYATDGEMTLVVNKINEIIDKINEMEDK